MSNFETLEELLNKPLPPVSARDPFYHTRQFPKFMKRMSVLEKDSSLIRTEKERSKKSDSKHRAWKPKNSGFGIKIIESVPSRLSDYDKAIDNQKVFTSISPKDSSYMGGFKHSVCPNTPSRSKSTQKRKKKAQQLGSEEIKRVKSKKISFVSGKQKVLALITGNSANKCLECGFAKCVCVSQDEQLIVNVFDTLNKGKVVLDEAKAKKRIQSLREYSIKNRKERRPRISIDEGLMRYSVATNRNAGSVLPEIQSFSDKNRRNSS